MKTEKFDLSELSKAVLSEAEVTIYHPVSGEDMGIRIRVHSPDSEPYRKKEREMKDRTFELSKKNRGGSLSSAALEAAAKEVILNAVCGWSGVIWAGSELECTPENVEMLFEKFPFIQRQVDAFLGDLGNFFTK